MKKFVIHASKGKTSILEIECEKVSPLLDPSVTWLPEGEFKVQVVLPKTLFEKQNDGSLAPPIYMSWALFDTQELAYNQAIKDLESNMRRSCSKAHCDPPTLKQVRESIAKIEVTLL